jgi:hypothetical protein
MVARRCHRGGIDLTGIVGNDPSGSDEIVLQPCGTIGRGACGGGCRTEFVYLLECELTAEIVFARARIVACGVNSVIAESRAYESTRARSFDCGCFGEREAEIKTTTNASPKTTLRLVTLHFMTHLRAIRLERQVATVS